MPSATSKDLPESLAKTARRWVPTTAHQHLAALPHPTLWVYGILKRAALQWAQPKWCSTRLRRTTAISCWATRFALTRNPEAANLPSLVLPTMVTSVRQVVQHLHCSTSQPHPSFCSSQALSTHSLFKVMVRCPTKSWPMPSIRHSTQPTNLKR